MSLPPGFLEELRNRLSLSQVVGRKVTWDPKKSNAAKGDHWAPCPFHQEKTASFHVDDRKGYYHCFGCQASGDAITFVRETENVGFMEAVEILAGEAGLQMPAKDPRAQEKAKKLTLLSDVMEEAVKYFRMQLSASKGSDARAYLAKRKMPETIQNQFEIGFAPDGWQNLFDHLTAKGIAAEKLIEVGLAKASQKGKKPYDTFRNRIMFPIRDARGRAIAFGGRAMDPNENAKYLNSPETPLFDKSRTLFNLGPARQASGKTGQLIVAEGYMDVIALAQFGFTHAVAPLGTAVTESQLQMMWRICPEPIFALDGDKAGLRAAERVIDLALPLLEAGRSLRFILLPEGKDPDDLLKEEGAPAFQALIETAEPLVNLLWRRETADQVFDSPERRADLDKRLKTAIKKIQDQSLRRHYGTAIQELRQTLFAPKRNTWSPDWKPGRRATPQLTPATKQSALAQSTDPRAIREAVITALIVTFPEAARAHESQLERLNFGDPDHDAIRRSALRYLHAAPDQFNAHLRAEIDIPALENLLARPYVRTMPVIYFNRTEDAEDALAEELAKRLANDGILDEVREAAEDLEGLADEGVTWRLSEAAKSRNAASRGIEQAASYENEDRKFYTDQLDEILNAQGSVKKKS